MLLWNSVNLSVRILHISPLKQTQDAAFLYKLCRAVINFVDPTFTSDQIFNLVLGYPQSKFLWIFPLHNALIVLPSIEILSQSRIYALSEKGPEVYTSNLSHRP